MIVLQDVAFSDLHALVEFIYHGEVNVHQRSLSSFLKTAEVLRVSGLTQQADQTDRDEVRASLLHFYFTPSTTFFIQNDPLSFSEIASDPAASIRIEFLLNY